MDADKLDMTLYSMKMHSATQYKNMAMAVKKTSYALYERLNSFARQDERQAEQLYKDALETNNLYLQRTQLYPLTFIDDLDTDPYDVTVDVVERALGHEEYVAKIFKQIEREGFYRIARYRVGMLTRILKYMKEGTLASWVGPAEFECSNCGYLKKETAQGVIIHAPETCPMCQAKQAAFVRYHEIGGI